MAEVDVVIIVMGAPPMLNADHGYMNHPLHGVIDGVEARGIGVEIRLMAVIQTRRKRLRERVAM